MWEVVYDTDSSKRFRLKTTSIFLDVFGADSIGYCAKLTVNGTTTAFKLGTSLAKAKKDVLGYTTKLLKTDLEILEKAKEGE